MTWTQFGNVAFFWAWWTFFEAVWIAVLWQSRTRVLGEAVYRMPGVRRVRRGAGANRVDTLLAELARRDVPADHQPDEGELLDRWHRIVTGRCVSVLLQAMPVLLVAILFWWATLLDSTMGTSFWMFAAIVGFGVVSLSLMAADERATAVSDPAGVVTVETIRFLEMLLVPTACRAQDSALDVHGKLFGRLCNALRAQARHGTRTMPPAARARVRATTEHLIEALHDADQRFLFGEGTDRDAAVHDLALLAADVLRHSCASRAQRDSLVVVDPRLLADAPETEEPDATSEPLRSRLLAGAGTLAVAMGLLAGAVLLPGGGFAEDLLTAAGLASIALVCPPLRDALLRARELLVGGSAADVRATGPTHEEAGATAPCQNCADRSAVVAGSRPVG
ncbi:hypothetical protein [Streptomyces microflavus]|uniref:hypothetical protein n=1 Tax=Streptomyces microflavus TaxID=1919 RepID=UPI0038157ACF